MKSFFTVLLSALLFFSSSCTVKKAVQFYAASSTYQTKQSAHSTENLVKLKLCQSLCYTKADEFTINAKTLFKAKTKDSLTPFSSNLSRITLHQRNYAPLIHEKHETYNYKVKTRIALYILLNRNMDYESV